jgi:hypothetical protein
MSDVARPSMSPLRRGCESLFDTEDKERNLFVLVEEANGVFCDSDDEPTTCVSLECCFSQVCLTIVTTLNFLIRRSPNPSYKTNFCLSARLLSVHTFDSDLIGHPCLIFCFAFLSVAAQT